MKRSQVAIIFGLRNLREHTGIGLVGKCIDSPDYDSIWILR